MIPPVQPGRSQTTRRRLLWIWRHGSHGDLRQRLRHLTLDQLEDTRRPLLFALLPRMLRRDGSTPDSLDRAFAHVDQEHDGASPAVTVSRQRWSRALRTSRNLASRRFAREHA